jgi:hypothetical protein
MKRKMNNTGEEREKREKEERKNDEEKLEK